MPPSLLVHGVRVPALLYGTAWKEDRTTELTALALSSGFRGIDTANQRKHYFEAAVGAAVTASALARADLFLQTKFTYARGQDHRLPYDPAAPYPAQVEQSFALSLEHLGVSSLDSLLLHGPFSSEGWNDIDRQVWRTMESLQERGRVALLGVSNVSAAQLRDLASNARVRPAFVQNRCYARTGWDRDVRQLCRELEITYQGFSLLTANRSELATPAVKDLARHRKVEISELVFAFAHAVGMLPLTGTSSRLHMEQDLRALDLELSREELEVFERLG